jgi:hypothetical protein
MNGTAWLMRGFGWLAILLGAIAFSVWLLTPRTVVPPTHVIEVSYYPQGTI